MTKIKHTFDSILVIAFGGPEKIQDIRPFLAKVTRGRVPTERLETVARHYELFGGKSPVREITFRQAEALKATLKDQDISLPVYVGMRNWHPFLEETVQQMDHDGVNRVVGVIMSTYQSRSSWEQYKSDVINAIANARAELSVAYAQPPFDQPGFIQTMVNRIRECREQIPKADREAAHILFTAHSLPHSDPQVELYAQQVHRSATLVGNRLNHSKWQVAYQSRSGRPQDPWLEPDVNDMLQDLGARGIKHVIVVPIGFVCDNVEVLYDLDVEAAGTAKEAGITMLRAKTVGDHPEFIKTLAELVISVLQTYRKPDTEASSRFSTTPP